MSLIQTGGLLGAGPVSVKKNIADQLLDAAVEGVGTVADVPGGIVDGLAKATGTSFLVNPIAYTGGFVAAVAGGQEVLKGKVGESHFYFQTMFYAVQSLGFLKTRSSFCLICSSIDILRCWEDSCSLAWCGRPHRL